MIEYEDWGSARIAQLEQHDLDRYHRDRAKILELVRLRRPVQRSEMGVPDYYRRFCYWREDMMSVGCPDNESSYIDDFIENLQWQIQLRVSNRRSRMSKLVDAFYEARFEETTLRLERMVKDLKAANEINEMDDRFPTEAANAVNEMDDSVGEESIANNQQTESYAEKLKANIAEPFAHKLFKFNDMPRSLSIEINEEYRDSDDVGACDEQYPDDGIQSNDSAIKCAEDGNHFTDKLLPNDCVVLGEIAAQIDADKVFVEMTEPVIEEDLLGTGVTKTTNYMLNGRPMLSPMGIGQPFLGSSSVPTIDVPNNGLAKTWVEESSLAIKTVSGKYVIEDDAYKVFGEMTQAIRAALLYDEVINHSAKYIDFEKLLLFDPGGNIKCMLSFRREVSCLLFGKAQVMFVFRFKGTIQSLRHAKLFIDMWKMHCLTSYCLKVALNRFDLSTQSPTKQNIGYEGLGIWDQSMVEFKEFTMEMMCGEIVLFMFDPGISSMFDEMFKSFQGAEHVIDLYGHDVKSIKLALFDPSGGRIGVLHFSRRDTHPLLGKSREMYVFGVKGVSSSHRHANLFINTSHRSSLQALLHDMYKCTTAVMILRALKYLEGAIVHLFVIIHPKVVVPADLSIQRVPFKFVGRSQLTLSYIEHIVYTLLGNSLSCPNVAVQRITRKNFHLLEHLHVGLMNNTRVPIVTKVAH